MHGRLLVLVRHRQLGEQVLETRKCLKHMPMGERMPNERMPMDERKPNERRPNERKPMERRMGMEREAMR